MDETPYVASASGPQGYGSVILPPQDTQLNEGDVIVIDTGSKFDGYYCDFDRNFIVGNPSKLDSEVKKADE